MVLAVQRFGSDAKDQRAAFYVVESCARGALSHLIGNDDACRAHIAEQLQAWHPAFQACVAHTESFVVREFVDHPEDPVLRDPLPPVVLMGDAVHGMTSYGGHGGNLALQDAQDVADAIASAGKVGSVVEGRSLCQRLLERSREASMETRALTKSFHSGTVVSTDTFDWANNGGWIGRTLYRVLNSLR